jgi:hypothetical protein
LASATQHPRSSLAQLPHTPLLDSQLGSGVSACVYYPSVKNPVRSFLGLHTFFVLSFLEWNLKPLNPSNFFFSSKLCVFLHCSTPKTHVLYWPFKFGGRDKFRNYRPIFIIFFCTEFDWRMMDARWNGSGSRWKSTRNWRKNTFVGNGVIVF